jgi:hypothetical protein
MSVFNFVINEATRLVALCALITVGLTACGGWDKKSTHATRPPPAGASDTTSDRTQ